jgi:CheY-like chemotaxis protein
MSVSFEVTDRVLARRGLEEARGHAEAASRAKDDFLAMLGHELRNPLAPIVTALNLMELRGIAGAERERSVISRQVQHLTRLVDDLLDVSRIIRGKVELAKQAVELSELVSRGLETASPLFEERNQYVEVKVPRHGLVLDADPARMAQALSNLFTNAAKYTDTGGHIAVTAERLGHDVVLRVSDDGVGIGEDMLVQIFDLFVQERQAIDRARGGLGLGLAIVKSVVTLHGGSVSAASLGVGQGSVFSVRLPLREAPTNQLTSDAKLGELPPPSHSAARRVLVVDDNEDAAEMLGIALRAAGHVTRQAHDGPSALAMLSEFAADVALLDLGLPAMDGYELATHIRAAHPGIRLVALTGYGQESDRERTRAAGFHEHLVKPAEMELVLRAVADTERAS